MSHLIAGFLLGFVAAFIVEEVIELFLPAPPLGSKSKEDIEDWSSRQW